MRHYLPAVAIILALVWFFTGCAAVETAADVVTILDAPEKSTQTETRTCTSDFSGNLHCVSTIKNSR